MNLYKKKVFSCDGTEFSRHPKVFFTSEFFENNFVKNSCDSKLQNKDILNQENKKSTENDKNQKIFCPYCGKAF
jgi:uncharacterized Zn-finger protein